jgi:hypothetical protein
MGAVLSKQIHGRIWEDRENICRIANIPVTMLEQSAQGICNATEFEWLKHYPAYKRQGKGLALTGKHTPPPDTKMMHLVAALLRNHIDARVVTLQGVIDAMDRGDSLDATVLFIPNMFQRQGPKGLHPFKMQMVYDLLLSRHAKGKLTVVYVEDLKAFGSEFGMVFQQHLEANYLISAG